MNRSLALGMTAVIALAGAALAVQQQTETQQSAQQQAQQREAQQQGQQHETYRNRPALERQGLDDQTQGKTIRASELMGMNVQNHEGESVAEIEDLVLDGKSGKLRYAAVTYGGFLGLGDKLFAVPFEAFRWDQDPNNADQRVLVLNVTEQQLENAEGFDQTNWPNFADREFTERLDKQYGVDRQAREREGQRDATRRSNQGTSRETERDSDIDIDVGSSDRDN